MNDERRNNLATNTQTATKTRTESSVGSNNWAAAGAGGHVTHKRHERDWGWARDSVCVCEFSWGAPCVRTYYSYYYVGMVKRGTACHLFVQLLSLVAEMRMLMPALACSCCLLACWAFATVLLKRANWCFSRTEN